MTGEQYKRANGVVFSTIVIILGYFVLSLVGFAATNGGTWRTWIQVAFSSVAIVICVLAFIFMRKTKKGALVLLSCATVAYVVLTIVNTSDSTYAYAFPIIFASMVFYNVKMVVAGNVIVLVSNILRTILQYDAQDSAYMGNALVPLFIICLVGVASIRSIQLLIKFNEENMIVITEAAAKQEESNKKMVIVAENIMKHFGEAMDMLDNLNTSIETCNFAMGNIAESTESTAEAIQKQATMCADIQENTDKAESSTKEMIDASKRTDATVVEGADVVRELKEQAENVETASSTTVEVIQSLTDKVAEVQTFVGSILNIWLRCQNFK